MLVPLLTFVGWMTGAFVGMEVLSYVLHRWVFHGPLWKIHESHHVKRHGTFERNDAFSAFFTVVAIVLLIVGLPDPLHSVAFPVGLGMTAYGMLYFLIHDLVTHKRFLPIRAKARWIQVVRRAHLHHHQFSDKPGHEPFGLFLLPYGNYIKPKSERSGGGEGVETDDD